MRMTDLNGEVGHFEILPPLARTASANGSGVDLNDYAGIVKVVLSSTAGGAGATMDVKIQDSDDNSSFADVAGYAFTQVGNAASLQSMAVDCRKVRRYIRAVTTIGGTASFVSVLLGLAEKQSV